ncbi:glycosyltransferase family 39 protein [Microcoleus sp. N9_A1]|uniref:glycosyltransferase family 39 protein n=1 Tax=Microcoleus sp. N9_A1 TaxID=3055380 RepID=UPI002FD0D62A
MKNHTRKLTRSRSDHLPVDSLPKSLIALLRYFLAFLVCYFCWQPAVLANSAANSSPQTLVTQEINYSLPAAGEVFLVWGVNDLATLPQAQGPTGTAVKDKIIYTPMKRQSNHFAAKVRVTAGATIDYVFQITKTRSGSSCEIWDKNSSANTKDYHTVAVQGGVAQIEAKTAIVNLLQAYDTTSSVFWWRASAIVLIVYAALLVAIFQLNTDQISTRGNWLLYLMQKYVKYHFSVNLFLFIVACYFVFLFCLEFPSIRMWDESRLAVNALEMTMNGDLIVTHFEGKPDMWNTKPPLLIWLIALSMKIFGYNTFSLRLPSAISAMSTGIIVFIFSAKYLKDMKIAWVSGLVLITSSAFIGFHAGRSGDYDAMLVLWITIYSLSYLIYLHSNELEKQRFYWSIATAALILAVLTKSVAGLMPLPGIFLYTVYQRKLKILLFSSRLYISLSILIGVVLSYYMAREFYNPGYLKAVVDNDLTGRYFNVHEKHQGSFLFYLYQIHNDRFMRWIELLPICLPISLLSVKKNLKTVGFFGFFYLTLYFTIVSFAKTKLTWYIIPLYPIASLVIGVGLTEIFKAILNSFPVNDLKRQLIFILTAIAIFILPYFDITYNLVYKQDLLSFDTRGSEVMYGDYFQEMFNDVPQLTKFTAVSNKYNAHLIFYAEVANFQNNYSISSVVHYQQQNKNKKFNPGEVVVTCEYEVTKRLGQQYNLKSLHSNDFCSTFTIEKLST